MTEQESQGVPDALDQKMRIEMDLHGPGNDWALQELAFKANTSSFSCGLVLTVQGQVISGMLMSAKDYFNGIADAAVAGLPEDTSEELREAYRQDFAGLYFEPEPDETGAIPPPGFIHLREARVYSPTGHRMPNPGMLWRGKINAVSGWSLGMLTPTNPD